MRPPPRRGLLTGARFVLTAADPLDGIADASVDVVTTRSVLIYVKDKAAALQAFYRVLRPGGRISVFEPINVLMRDTWPVGRPAASPRFEPLAAKLTVSFFRSVRPSGADPHG